MLKIYFEIFNLILFIIGDIFFLLGLSVIIQLLEIVELLALKKIIDYFNKQNGSSDSLNKNATYFVITKIASLLISKQFQIYQLNLTSKAILQLNMLIFEKILRFSNSSGGQKYSEAQIITHMQNDSTKLGHIFTQIPNMFIFPIKFLVYIVMLFNLFGFSFMIGMILFYFSVHMNNKNQKRFPGLESELLKKKDFRMKLVTEFFDAIKMIKMYAWENCFLNEVLFAFMVI